MKTIALIFIYFNLAVFKLSASEVAFNKFPKIENNKFSRHSHGHKALILALDKTVKTHGKYKITYATRTTRNRVLVEIKMVI